MSNLCQLIILITSILLLSRFVSDLMQFHLGRRNVSLLKGEESLPEDRIFDRTLPSDIHPTNKLVLTGMYAIHLHHWLKFFPKEQFHFVDGDILVRRPWEELEKLEDFLGVPNEITEERFFFNATKGFYCVKTEDPSVESCMNETKGRRHPKIPDELYKRLKSFYKPWNIMFYKLSGIVFDWN